MFSSQERKDLLTTALEGASNYWYRISNCDIINEYTGNYFIDKLYKAILDGKTIVINDIENPEDEIGELNLENIMKGEISMAEQYPENIINIFTDNWDAIDADIWFQFVTMNELIFG